MSYDPDNLDDETLAMMGTSPVVQEHRNFDSYGGRAYEAASTTSRELAFHAPALRSADGDILPDKRNSDTRTRDAFRNDGYVHGAGTLMRDTIVGSTYMLTVRPNSALLFGREDTKWEDEYAEEVEGKFTLFAESPENWIDASRINNFTQFIRLGVSVHFLAGELLSSAEWRRDWDGLRPYNTCMQMIDTDRLSNDPAIVDRYTRGGVRKDKFGAPQGYYIRDAHPSDYLLSPDTHAWTYYPARLPWGRMSILHIFDQDRADQTRGIAMLTAALKETKMASRFRDIAIQNAVVNATYAASIESELPTEAIFARLGAGGGTMDGERIQEAINGYIGGYFGEIANYLGGSKGLTLEGVKIPHLPPGSKLQLRPAGNAGPLGTDFESSLMRYVAASLGTSYEELSRDFTKTNYSGFKGAVSISQRTANARKKNTADRLATYIFRLWFEEAFNKGTFETLKRRKTINLYENQGLDMLTACSWIGASFGQVDEMKETQAAALRIANGLSTLQDEAARLGKDWRQLVKQLKREQDWLTFYGIDEIIGPKAQNKNKAGSSDEKEEAPASEKKDNE